MTWIVTRFAKTIFLPSRLSISWLCYKSLFRNLRIHYMTWFVIRLVLSDSLFGGKIVWICHVKESNLTRIKQRWAISHSHGIWMFHTCECVLSLQQKYNSSRLTSRRWLWGLSVSVCCSVMQCVAVCCSVLQCVAVCVAVPVSYDTHNHARITHTHTHRHTHTNTDKYRLAQTHRHTHRQIDTQIHRHRHTYIHAHTHLYK